MALRVLLAAAAAGHAAGTEPGRLTVSVSLDFSDNPSATFRTTPTLQVVTNPLLDREFVFPNGTRIPNPIYENAWASLGNLKADRVRFQPWFPYPHKAVPELEPSRFWKKETSWDFSGFLPQLQDFMAQTSEKGHSVIWNFGTIPCWMFGLAHCTFPKDPSTSDFSYGDQGRRKYFWDQSGKMLAEYLARIMSYLVKGEFTDEKGVVHTGGPKYNFTRANGDIFEFLNEGEHGYSPAFHTHDYDIVVNQIMDTLGGREASPDFMGIGGCQNGNWAWWFMGNCSEWLPVFLNRSNHVDKAIPMDYVSIHYYASASNRSEVNSYTRGLFGSADDWLVAMDENLQMRDSMAPNVKIGMTELGTLMVDDMSHTFGADGGLPDLYFNAAGAFYAYIFGHMSLKQLEFVCFSQLIGSPPIPEWNIHDMQFPSASMLSWETGHGNAKYWVLKLLIDNLRSGDVMHEAEISPVHRADPRQVMCEHVGHWNFFGSVTLVCEDPNAVIEEIWADFGEPPTGTCGNYEPSKNCSSHVLASLWAGWECKGKNSCTLKSDDRIATAISCPVRFQEKKEDPHSLMLTVQAKCSGDKGGRTSSDYNGASVYAIGFAPPAERAAKDGKQLYLVNKQAETVEVTLDASNFGTDEVVARIVDPSSAQRSSEQGIRTERWTRDASGKFKVTLQPYAVVIAEEVMPSRGMVTFV